MRRGGVVTGVRNNEGYEMMKSARVRVRVMLLTVKLETEDLELTGGPELSMSEAWLISMSTWGVGSSWRSSGGCTEEVFSSVRRLARACWGVRAESGSPTPASTSSGSALPGRAVVASSFAGEAVGGNLCFLGI